MAKMNLKVNITYRWWFMPSIHLYILWCKFWLIVPSLNEQFLKAGVIVTPESKT